MANNTQDIYARILCHLFLVYMPCDFGALYAILLTCIPWTPLLKDNERLKVHGILAKGHGSSRGPPALNTNAPPRGYMDHQVG